MPIQSQFNNTMDARLLTKSQELKNPADDIGVNVAMQQLYTMYQNDLDNNEYQINLTKMHDIRTIFKRIEIKIESDKKKLGSPLLSQDYENLLRSIAAFENKLCEEKQTYPDAISTAKKLEECVDVVLDEKINLEKKSDNINGFMQYARNATFTASTKMALGAVIGSLLTSMVVIGLSVIFALPTGGLSLLLIIPAAMAVGGLNGISIGKCLSLNQDDKRGKQVCKNLKVLTKSRQGFFKGGVDQSQHLPNKNKPEVKLGLTRLLI